MPDRVGGGNLCADEFSELASRVFSLVFLISRCLPFSNEVLEFIADFLCLGGLRLKAIQAQNFCISASFARRVS